MASNKRIDPLEIEHEKENKWLIFHLLLGAISFLFIGLILAYAYQIIVNDVASYTIPWMFYINTLLLISVSILIYRSKGAEFALYRKRSQQVFILIIVFFLLQCVAWWQLFVQLDHTSQRNGIYFLYLLSIVHCLHVIGGLPFHFVYLRKARLYPVLPSVKKSILRYRLHLMHEYWHYLDVLWLILMTTFILHMTIG